MAGLEEKPLKIIFLFGAGASRDAGIPTINELTKEFVEDPAKAVSSFYTFPGEGASKIKTDVETLANVTEKFQGKMDLELMMSLVLRISDKKEKQLLETTYHDLKSIDNERIQEIKNLIQGYIRKKCEDITSVEYFWPLEGMSKNKKLDIFTLNYDGTVEIFCEERGIKYTDGFEPDWNIKRFDDDESKINLYKLHGSLYWFRTKSKGCHCNNCSLFTVESYRIRFLNLVYRQVSCPVESCLVSLWFKPKSLAVCEKLWSANPKLLLLRADKLKPLINRVVKKVITLCFAIFACI